ncbi:putative RNA (uracil-5-)methyltransferase [Cryptosporidium felis]|nr:putative RNA (uracil-5-)methyltransferase [Cryptosporidium felis]
MRVIKDKKIELDLNIIKKKVTPFHNKDYYLQLEYKYNMVRGKLRQLTHKVYSHAINRGLAAPQWCKKENIRDDINSSLRLEVEDVIPLKPVVTTTENKNTPYSYRNKCEFTIGYTRGDALDWDSNISIGFVSHIDKFEPIVVDIFNVNSLNSTEVSETLDIINPCIIPIIRKMEQIVKTSTRENSFKVYSRRNRKGVWRLLLIRVSETSKEIMITVQTTTLEVNENKHKVLKLLLEGLICDGEQMDLNGYKINCIYLHQSDSIVDTFEIGKLELIYGNPGISFKIRNTELSIGPLSFFQTNTKGCEVLYNEIKKIIEVNIIENLRKRTSNLKKLIIFDICCGVGSIGLYLLDILLDLENHFEEVELIGIDCSNEAIESARENAVKSGIKNAKYISGTAESILPDLLENINHSDLEILAIVDPPRNGLHGNVVKLLRQMHRIKSLIYVSCNVESLVKNCLELCSTFDPHTDNCDFFTEFTPKYAVPVDMFPYTKHIETIVYLERSCNGESKDIHKRVKFTRNPLLLDMNI